MTDVISLGERVARMEEKLAHVLENQRRRLDKEEIMEEKMDILLTEIGRSKGFVGGILFVLGSLWAFIKLALPAILRLLGKET